MSRTNTPFVDCAVDPFLSSMNGQPDFAQLDHYFANQDSGAAFSPANSEILDDLESMLNDDPLSHSSDTISTPGFASYTLEQHQQGTGEITSSPYPPTPAPNRPHPYPLQLQQSFQPQGPRSDPSSSHLFTQSRRPIPNRTHTASSSSHCKPPSTTQRFSSRVHQPHHRRSLSQGDADRIAAAAATATNPVFFRLQAPRARSTTPTSDDDSHRFKQRKAGTTPYQKSNSTPTSRGPSLGPSASVSTRKFRGAGQQYFQPIPTSTPVSHRNNQARFERGATPCALELQPTSLGTPLQSSPSSAVASPSMSMSISPPRSQDGDHMFKHLGTAEKMEASRRIIEIGAMAVVNLRSSTYRDTRTGPDSVYEDRREDVDGDSGNPNITRMLNQIRDVKEFMQQREDLTIEQDVEDFRNALNACDSVGATLIKIKSLTTKGNEVEDTMMDLVRSSVEHTGPDSAGSDMIKPSDIFAIEDSEMYNGAGEDDLFNLLLCKTHDGAHSYVDDEV